MRGASPGVKEAQFHLVHIPLHGHEDIGERLEWILRHAWGRDESQKTVPGVSPTRAELESQTELFDKAGNKLPDRLKEQRQILIKSFS